MFAIAKFKCCQRRGNNGFSVALCAKRAPLSQSINYTPFFLLFFFLALLFLILSYAPRLRQSNVWACLCVCVSVCKCICHCLAVAAASHSRCTRTCTFVAHIPSIYYFSIIFFLFVISLQFWTLAVCVCAVCRSFKTFFLFESSVTICPLNRSTLARSYLHTFLSHAC